MKHNIKPLDGALDRLLQLKGASFEWNKPEEHQNRKGIQSGVIAQEVEQVFPDWVHTDPETHFKVVQPDERAVLGLTVEAFRTLKAKSDADDKKIADLQGRMDRLENGSNPPRAGFTYGNGGWAVAGVLFGVTVMSRRKQQTA